MNAAPMARLDEQFGKSAEERLFHSQVTVSRGTRIGGDS